MKKIFLILFCALSVLTTANAQTGTREMRIVPLDGASLRQENGAWIIRLADIDSIDFRTINNSTTPDEGEGVEPDGQEHAYVDLGLPSGTLWATCNVGAAFPVESGDFFAWGEVKPKEVYNENTYKWLKFDTIPEHVNDLGLLEPEQIKTYILKYNTDATYSQDGTVDNKLTLDSIDDAAAVNWGGAWRIPTHDQVSELISECTWEKLKGVKADGDSVTYYKVTGPSTQAIYLPVAGYFNNASLSTWSNAYYWSSSLRANSAELAYRISFGFTNLSTQTYRRYFGLSVRPVCSGCVLTLVSDETQGSVTGAGTYIDGTSVTITATAKDGYRFDGWSDGNKDNPRTLVLKSDSTLTATFIIKRPSIL